MSAHGKNDERFTVVLRLRPADIGNLITHTGATCGNVSGVIVPLWPRSRPRR
jgi:hypothetical protein